MRRSCLVTLSLVTLLAGCTPTVFGVPEAQWARMSPEQQKTVREAYLERERLREERYLIEARAREHERQQALLRAQQEANNPAPPPAEPARQKAPSAPPVVVAPPERIRVSLSGGTALIDGQRRVLQPASFEINEGELRKVEIEASAGRHTLRTDLGASYHKGLFLLDLNPPGKGKAARMDFSANWVKGGAYYHVDTEGPLLLRGVKVKVEAVPYRESASAPRVQPSAQQPAHAQPSYSQPFAEPQPAPQPSQAQPAPALREPAKAAPVASMAHLARAVKENKLKEPPPSPKVPFPEHLVVTLNGGTAVMEGHRRELQTLSFGIRQGESRKETLQGTTGNKGYQAELDIRYRDGILTIDAVDDAKATRVEFTPDWLRGPAEYLINSEGPLSLRGAKLQVEAVTQ